MHLQFGDVIPVLSCMTHRPLGVSSVGPHVWRRERVSGGERKCYIRENAEPGIGSRECSAQEEERCIRVWVDVREYRGSRGYREVREIEREKHCRGRRRQVNRQFCDGESCIAFPVAQFSEEGKTRVQISANHASGKDIRSLRTVELRGASQSIQSIQSIRSSRSIRNIEQWNIQIISSCQSNQSIQSMMQRNIRITDLKTLE